MLDKVIGIFKKKESSRTSNAKINILLSFFLKGVNILVYFLIVPVTLSYLPPVQYGIWLTLSSILSYLIYFDVGLGHGLRNRLAEALASKNLELAQEYISTSFALLLLLIVPLCCLFFLVGPFLEWDKILNSPHELRYELKNTVNVVFFLFSFQFVLRTINIILLADQKPAWSDLIVATGNVFSLLLLFFIGFLEKSNLTSVGFAFSISQVLILIVACLLLFKGRYHEIRPRIKMVRFYHTKPLLGLGIKFFVLQITALLMWNSSNIVITRMLGPVHVGPFNIAHRYFSAITMLFTIVLNPFWSAFTDAYFKQEIEWIKQTIFMLLKWFAFCCAITVVLLFLAPYVYDIWIGDAVEIPFTLNLLLGLFVLSHSWQNIFIFFLNGVGMIRLQLYSNLIVGILCIPINIFCIEEWGLNGAAIALVIVTLSSSVFAPIQYYMIVYKRAKGIWVQ